MLPIDNNINGRLIENNYDNGFIENLKNHIIDIFKKGESLEK